MTQENDYFGVDELREIKLDCLKIAKEVDVTNTADEIVKEAQKLYDFVINKNNE